MGYLAPFSSLVGVSLIWDGLFVTTCKIEVLEYCGTCEALVYYLIALVMSKIRRRDKSGCEQA